ncbi:hypothetical protein OC842_002408 [Tilletia horrida]|uniref:GATA-type domain-containing protein n=1 Tax=Tilletia horrida TaxID=155126 RepID=A0AAN6JLP3_9BASI|nr:hypothetical protein OC842_002408 [Tilletia horrida]
MLVASNGSSPTLRPQSYQDSNSSPYPLPPRTRTEMRRQQHDDDDDDDNEDNDDGTHVPHRSRCYWAILAVPTRSPASLSSAPPSLPSSASSASSSSSAAAAASSSSSSPASASAASFPVSDVEALEIVYIDPTFQSHLGPQAAHKIHGQPFFTFVHPDDAPSAKADMSDLLGPLRTTFGSVIRCRFANVAAFRNQLVKKRPRNSHYSSRQTDRDASYPAVDLVISYIGDGLALCFMHNIVDESLSDSDEQNKSEWSNWCGMSSDLFNPKQADTLWRQICQRRAGASRTQAPEHIFQILRSPQKGGDILFSWPPPRLFPAQSEHSQAASAIAESAFTHYEDGSYFADDFAALAQGLDTSLFALSDASTTCTRRLRAKHTLSTDGLLRTVESVVIGYGDLIIAMFTNTFQQRIVDLNPAASAMPVSEFPAIIPLPSQLQEGLINAAALAAQSQVALMSQSPTTLSPVLLQQTLSPRQSTVGLNAGADPALLTASFVPTVDGLPHSAPPVSTTFDQANAQGASGMYARSLQAGSAQGENFAFNTRRSFDESFLAPHTRAKTLEKSMGADERRMSDTSFAHRRAVTFNPDVLPLSSQTGHQLSQHHQLLMDTETDDGAAAQQRFRNPSHSSFASSAYSSNLSTIDSSTYDSMASSMASTETMFSPRQSMKWGSISSESASAQGATGASTGIGSAHRDSFASSVSSAGLDAAAVAAATAAAAAADARRRSRQETWPLARIDDETLATSTSASASASAATSTAMASTATLQGTSSDRSRSISAAIMHTDGSILAQQMNVGVSAGGYAGSRLSVTSLGLPPTVSPLDPSSAAASAAAASAVAAAASGTNAGSALFPMGIPGNSLNPYAAIPSPTAPTFSFGASPDVRPTLELPPLDPIQPLPQQSISVHAQEALHGNAALQSSGTAMPPLLTETFDPSTGLHGGGPFVSSFAPHCRAMSAPGLGLGAVAVAGMPLSSGPYGLRHPGMHGQQHQVPPKMCASCGTTNSPEWRRGPSGHKTLCNACGLRYSRSVLRAKKREEKRKASEPSLRRASEVAAAATTAAAAAAAAVAASAAAGSLNKFADAPPVSREAHAAADGEDALGHGFGGMGTGTGTAHRRTRTVPAHFPLGAPLPGPGPTAEAMSGVISSEGRAASPDPLPASDGAPGAVAAHNNLSLGLHMPEGGSVDFSGGSAAASDASQQQQQQLNGALFGFEPPFLSSRAATGGSTGTSVSNASYSSSSASSFFGGGAGGGFGIPTTNGDPHGSMSSVTTLGSFQSHSQSGHEHGHGQGHAMEGCKGLVDGLALPMGTGEGPTSMERTTTADWMPFASFEHPAQGHDVDIAV